MFLFNRTFVVDFDPVNIDELDKIKPVIEAFSVATKKNIFVSNPHGDPTPPLKDRKYGIYIHFWSLPTTFPRKEFKKVYGIKLAVSQTDAVVNIDFSRRLDYNEESEAIILVLTFWLAELHIAQEVDGAVDADADLVGW